MSERGVQGLRGRLETVPRVSDGCVCVAPMCRSQTATHSKCITTTTTIISGTIISLKLSRPPNRSKELRRLAS